MIVTRLCCGLGNQMFQYALAKHLTMKNDTELRFDISWWEQQDRYAEGQDWTRTLFEYDVMGEIATEEEVRSVLNLGEFTHWMRGTKDVIQSPYPEKFHINLDYIPRLFPSACGKLFNFYREVRGSPKSRTSASEWPHRRRFCPAMLNIQDDAYLDGYWQSSKYFKEITSDIRDDLSISDPLPGKNATTADRIANTPAVSVHIRRGDQITRGPASDKVGNSTPLKYFEEAADYITDYVDNPTFFIFSDDPQWAKKNLSIDYGSYYITYNGEETDYLDIELMRRCDHHIIGNSTFSWWGAWLNDDPDKIVVAPMPWKRYGYPDGAIHDWDLIPDDWVIIDYRN